LDVQQNVATQGRQQLFTFLYDPNKQCEKFGVKMW